MRRAGVRAEKPRLGAFTSADLPKILSLLPYLVLGFSDLQAEIAAGLIRAGIEVQVFNQRDVAGILRMIRNLGAMIGCADQAEVLAAGYEARIAALRAIERPQRPRVFIEEWDEPLISGIGWVSELVEIAGGQDVFPELAAEGLAKDRILLPAAVPPRAPERCV